ncbi:MAG TPA: hydroxymethylbilane synthase [Dehalococcoidia bacterium]|nr:hydroxymethylbilane synthase [Dehalococcoidia bacterium]
MGDAPAPALSDAPPATEACRLVKERPRQALRAGTRGSALALRQTELIVNQLRAAHPHVRVKSVPIRTQGDRDRSTPLSLLGGKGVFVKELEAALLDGRIDFAVHSLKDVPSTLPEGLAIVAVGARADARDALVSRHGATLAQLPAGAHIGTGSRRRRAELLALRPDIVPVEVRGNVGTRIGRVRDGSLDAVVLAVAGLERLGRLHEAAQIFAPDELLPAVGQGALAVEAREGDQRTAALFASIDDADTHRCVRAERAFLARLGAGCTTPAAAYCTHGGASLLLRALIAGDDGVALRETRTGVANEPEALGVAVAGALIERGALGLLARST